jgi:hypothetical protein
MSSLRTHLNVLAELLDLKQAGKVSSFPPALVGLDDALKEWRRDALRALAIKDKMHETKQPLH